MNPFQVVKDFEHALCNYTGAPYAVTTSSCTMALLLACKYLNVGEISIPRRTYVSVPQSIIHAGGRVVFDERYWSGDYYLLPYPIVDSARRFTSGMYKPGDYTCVSFHESKILGHDQGGAILHADPIADEWFRRARFDGRRGGVAPKDDHFDMIGYHCYMSPGIAAELLRKLTHFYDEMGEPIHHEDMPNDDYPDLSQFPVFGRRADQPDNGNQGNQQRMLDGTVAAGSPTRSPASKINPNRHTEERFVNL